MENELGRISVVGLGKLGLPLAVCFAWRGFSTIGVDIDSAKVQALNQGSTYIYEPGLKELLNTAGARLTFTSDCEKAVFNSDVTFILVPTPGDNHRGFSLRYVLEAAKQIGQAIAKKSAYHLVVLTSTVMPGSTQDELQPALETYSGKLSAKDFGLCYNPEFVALGSVIADLLHPDLVLIGESDARAGAMLARLYMRFCENKPAVARMNFINAELTKLAVNTYVTTKITFANTLARICERLPGADAHVVSSALGLDSRIGGKYLKGAIGYGGPCFPRDNLALATLARSLGASAVLAEATDSFNRQQVRWMVELIKGHYSGGNKVGILGLAYKPNSCVVEEAQGLLLAQALADEKIEVIVFDPAAMDNARKLLNTSAIFAASARECINKSDIVVVATAWEEFKQLSPEDFKRPEPGRVVIDCWRILERLGQEEGVNYVPLGIGDLTRR